MRRLASAAAMLSTLVVALADANAQGPSQPRLVCDRGPIATKTYGGTPWQMYGCHDNRSGAIGTAPGSPALPFHFLLAEINGLYTVSGVGTGRPELKPRAYNDILTLSRRPIH